MHSVVSIASAAELSAIFERSGSFAIRTLSAPQSEFPAIMALLTQNAYQVKALAIRVFGKVDFSTFSEMVMMELAGVEGAFQEPELPPNITHLALSCYAATEPMLEEILNLSLTQICFTGCAFENGVKHATYLLRNQVSSTIVVFVDPASWINKKAEMRALTAAHADLNFYGQKEIRNSDGTCEFRLMRVSNFSLWGNDNDDEQDEQDEVEEVLAPTPARTYEEQTREIHRLEAVIWSTTRSVWMRETPRIAELNRQITALESELEGERDKRQRIQ